MAAPGKCVVRDTGKLGLLESGKLSAFNEEGQCPACCIEFTQAWSFTDQGFIAGGQNGALRSYDDPESVPASPWTIQNGGLGLRLDWEDDDNCANFNPNTQRATATAAIVVPVDTIMTVTWSGVGETEDPNFELMSLSVDGTLVGKAHAPGGNQGCAPMGPVVSDPPPPQQAMLTPGEYTLTITATTNDPLYHVGAWYQFGLLSRNAQQICYFRSQPGSDAGHHVIAVVLQLRKASRERLIVASEDATCPPRS